MQAPPPPIQRKKSSWPLIIGIGGALLVIVIAVCAFGGYKLSQIVKEPPKPMANSGKPIVVVDLPGGWKTYRFPEGPFRFDLPGAPTFDTIEFDPIDSLAIVDYTFYDVAMDSDMLQLAAFHYRSREMVDLKDEAESVIKELGASDLKKLDSSHDEATIGSLTGREVRLTYTVEGSKGICRVFMWAQDKTVYMIQAFFVEENAVAKEAEYRRIIESFTSN